MVPLVLFLTIVAIGVSLGMQTGYALNPARDLGPRIMASIFYGREVFNYRSQYWLWTPVLGPTLGAIAGTAVYDICVYTEDDSRVNSSQFHIRPFWHASQVKGDSQV
ncbi:hypothetical protein FRC02_005613 [Tulasnella sp. 418]|nr:hypothetical protein FRC02_005613 [Tulasnella sp. 418]